jgi:hypothetical protein
VSRRNRRCGVSNNVNGCDGEAPNFFSVPRQMILVSNGDSMCARVFRRLNGLCIKF